VTGTVRSFDAAFPPAKPPALDGFAFYIGGDTPHPWAKTEIVSQANRYGLPIWVRSEPAGFSGTTQGVAAVAALHALGVPEGTVCALDIETATDSDFCIAFSKELNAQKYGCVLYGSKGNLFRNQLSGPGWYWVADPGATGLVSGTVMTQYEEDADDGQYDLSYVDETWMTANWWDLREPPAPKPPAKTNDEDEDMTTDMDEDTTSAVISLTSGSKSFIAFFADPTRTGKKAQALRVAVHSAKDGFSQIESSVSVGAEKAVIQFTAKDVTGVSIARTDSAANWVPVSWNLG
jgi:hypothetical protein